MTTQMTLMKPTISQEKLEKLESKVRSGMASFVEVGRSLAEIRDGGGYILRGFGTFEEYCVEVFDATDRHARRLIEGAQASVKVQKALGEAPRNEGVAREFAPIVDDPVVLGKVAAHLERKKIPIGKATAAAVAEAVAKVTGKTKPAGTNGKSAPKAPPEVKLPTLTDICPDCQMTPTNYNRQDNGWHCGACGAPVLLGVIAAKPAGCPNCHAVVTAGDEFCGNCGGAL